MLIFGCRHYMDLCGSPSNPMCVDSEFQGIVHLVRCLIQRRNHNGRSIHGRRLRPLEHNTYGSSLFAVTLKLAQPVEQPEAFRIPFRRNRQIYELAVAALTEER